MLDNQWTLHNFLIPDANPIDICHPQTGAVLPLSKVSYKTRPVNDILFCFQLIAHMAPPEVDDSLTDDAWFGARIHGTELQKRRFNDVEGFLSEQRALFPGAIIEVESVGEFKQLITFTVPQEWVIEVKGEG